MSTDIHTQPESVAPLAETDPALESVQEGGKRLLCDDPDIPGLLWAMRFDESGRGQVIPHDEPIPPLGSFGEGFIWLHLNLVDGRVAKLVQEGRLGPPRIAESAFSRDEHQRVVVDGEYVGGVVADLAHKPGSDAVADSVGRLHFIMGPNFLVSGRRQPVVSPEAARTAATEGESIAAPILLLETLVGHAITTIARGGAGLAEDLDEVEDRVLDAPMRDDRRRLGPIRRDAVRLHRQLLGLRAVFHRLEDDGATNGLPAAEIAAAARIAQRLDALDRDMVVLAERSRLLQEELAAQRAEQTNRQLYTLSILTALFLPPTLITGVFGMNTKGLPFADAENGSALAIGLALASALAAYLLIRVLGIRPPRD